MKKLVLKKWIEFILYAVMMYGLFLVGIFEHNDISLYIYGSILFILSSGLLLRYGRN